MFIDLPRRSPPVHVNPSRLCIERKPVAARLMVLEAPSETAYRSSGQRRSRIRLPWGRPLPPAVTYVAMAPILLAVGARSPGPLVLMLPTLVFVIYTILIGRGATVLDFEAGMIRVSHSFVAGRPTQRVALSETAEVVLRHRWPRGGLGWRAVLRTDNTEIDLATGLLQEEAEEIASVVESEMAKHRARI